MSDARKVAIYSVLAGFLCGRLSSDFALPSAVQWILLVAIGMAAVLNIIAIEDRSDD